MKVLTIPCLSDNYTYLLESDEELAIMDACEADPIIAALRGRKLTSIFLTHHHHDHIGAAASLKQRFGAKVYAARRDSHRIADVDHWLTEGDSVKVGAETAQVWEIPGHTTGHIAYYFTEAKSLFCGDTLFSLGCGRLFEGTPQQMWSSLSRIRDLPWDTRVYCGHEYTLENGAYASLAEPNNESLQRYLRKAKVLRAQGLPTVPSLMGEERAANPFLRPESDEIRARVKADTQDPVEIFARVRSDKDNWDKSH